MPETGCLAVFPSACSAAPLRVVCGGIVAQHAGSGARHRPQWPLHLAYNLGRITYTLLGAGVGLLGSVGLLYPWACCRCR